MNKKDGRRLEQKEKKREAEIRELVSAQRRYFLSGVTLSYEARMDALRRVRWALRKFEPQLLRS